MYFSFRSTIIILIIYFETIRSTKSTPISPSDVKNLTCWCDSDSIYPLIDGTYEIIECKNGTCTVPYQDPRYYQKSACMIETTISVRPYRLHRRCSQSSPFGTEWEKQIAVIWTVDSKLLVYHKCAKSFCNDEYPKSWSKENMDIAVQNCLPTSPKRLRRMLEPRRNFATDILTCECNQSGQNFTCSADNRCDNERIIDEQRHAVICWRMGQDNRCAHMTKSYMSIVKTYRAGYLFNPSKLQFYGCRYDDLCNVDVPAPTEKQWDVPDAVCHWFCPKLNLTKIPVEWWQFTILAIVGVLFVCVLAQVIFVWFRYGVRLSK